MTDQKRVFDLKKLKDAEWEYIVKRRDKNSLNNQDPELLAGICFSGGGIRSATFCLGIMQGLIKKNIFRVFDYLCTVSGGGYIASCLTSLLTGKKLKNKEQPGVQKKNSPFVGLNKEKIEYSWWSYRAGARPKNIGWRIDYFWVSDRFLKNVKKAFIMGEVMGSDHCPVGIELK